MTQRVPNSFELFTAMLDQAQGMLANTYDGYGVYVISVASRLAEMHPNTLRKYERAGLINPNRTAGRQRLYSDEDLRRLRFVRTLGEKYALNLQGTNLVMELLDLLSQVVLAVEQGPQSDMVKVIKRIRGIYQRLATETEQV